jgi:hypothetical protein
MYQTRPSTRPALETAPGNAGQLFVLAQCAHWCLRKPISPPTPLPGGVSSREVQQLTRGLKAEELPSLGLEIDDDGAIVSSSSASSSSSSSSSSSAAVPRTGVLGKHVIFRSPKPAESKFKTARAKAVFWQWRPLQSSARGDLPTLRHWQRATYNQDYRYAKFSTWSRGMRMAIFLVACLQLEWVCTNIFCVYPSFLL